jgi:NADH-quinone oxidoreductase subunit F
MTIVHRVLPAHPILSLDQYTRSGGGSGLVTAQHAEPEELIAELEASGLRGRGGAGFPTGRKWRTVLENHSDVLPTTVVVNAAEGEPGTFKDRAILDANPYHVLEGALIAAHAVAANQVIVALKRSFARQVTRVQAAIDEIHRAGWSDGIELVCFEGPSEYLYGEETALLEAIDGRYPFPRIAPPYRRGVNEVFETAADVEANSGLSAHVEMAGTATGLLAPPTLVDNVETMANVPRIIAEGEAWFRTEGTAESPGTIVCTVTGATQRHGVGEVVMGTPLREVIEAIGGGPRPGHRIKAVLPGVSNSLIPEAALGTGVSYEGLAAIGSGLGSAGFIVTDSSDDLVAVVAGISRFLAIESCGQCSPCKQDGLALSRLLAQLCRSQADTADLAMLRQRVETVADSARCALALAHQAVVRSLLDRFDDEIQGHLSGRVDGVEAELIAELVAIDSDVARVNEHQRLKQPDWTYTEVWSGMTPADLYGDHRAHLRLDDQG